METQIGIDEMDIQLNGKVVSQLEWLIQINLDDFCAAFGVSQHPALAWSLKKLLRPAARRFARQIIDFDQEVLELGLEAASRQFMASYGQGMEVTGQERLPASGPLLVLANHPGLTDTLALFANIPRPDLRIIALERPFLHAMPETASRLIFVPPGSDGRLDVIRSVAGHLRQGGAVLTFPAGEIEPDPAYLPGAIASLNSWSTSLALFVHLSPETRVVPAVVSAVYSPHALRHPISRLRRQPKDRETLAANLQILVKSISTQFWPVRLQLDFGRPTLAADLLKLENPALITQAVAFRMRALLEAVHPVKARRPLGQSQPIR